MYRTMHTIHRYDTIHTIHIYVLDDSWALMIRLYDLKLFVHDMIRIAYHTILTTTEWIDHKRVEWNEIYMMYFIFWYLLKFIKEWMGRKEIYIYIYI